MFLILSLLLNVWAIIILVISFANILSRSVGCVFILWMVSFAVQKLKFDGVHLFMFAFDSFALGDRSLQKNIAMIYVTECSACVLFKSYIVSSLTLRSLIYFEFIFVYGVTNAPISLIFVRLSSFPHTHLLNKRLSFLYCIFLPFLS